MNVELSDQIMEIVGTESSELLVIADGEIDVNASSIKAEDIKTASFSQYGTIVSGQKETIKDEIELSKGVHVFIEKSLKEPLHIVLEHGEDMGQYVFIEVADNVEATIIEHHVACDCGCAFEEVIVPTKIEVSIGEGANILYSAFDTSGLVMHVQRFLAIHKDTTLDVAIGMFGDSCESENFIALYEEGAEVESKLMMFAKDTQRQLHKIKMSHFAPYTKSNIINHGVVADHAKGEFEGIGFIEKGSHQADAQQESRIMVLDEHSRADVHPILLIDEYDVMAGHAGSVGRVSDDALYYLQSRGLTRKEAMLLVTEGFLRPVVENIKDENTRARIEGVIREKVGLKHV